MFAEGAAVTAGNGGEVGRNGMVMDAQSEALPRTEATPEASDEKPRISTVLLGLRDRLPTERVRIGDVVDALGDHCFGSAVLVLAVPVMLPVPLGLAFFLAVPILVYTGRVMLGAPVGHLPGWVNRQSVKTDLAARMIDRTVPRLRRIEPWLRPRWGLLVGASAELPLAAACFLLSVVAVIPLPLTGWLPGFALLIIGLGLVARDGLAVLAGLALGGVSILVLIGVVVTLVQAGRLLLTLDMPM